MAPTDRDALVALYNSADGPNWSESTGWDTDAPLSDWYGVTANDEGRVVKLSLIANNLRGPIPPELGNLAALEILNLGANGLSGPIPPELGNLAALQSLDLFANTLSGSIPKELGDLRELRTLWLGKNGLSGAIPSDLGHLSALKDLYLSRNQLSGSIPPELGKLPALKALDLSVNQLSGHIPRQLGDLGALQALNLGYNELDGHIPPQLGQLGVLQYLSLANNELDGPIPRELGNLAALQSLKLYGNKLSGPMPPELGNLAALQVLILGRNELSGLIPKELGALIRLEKLSLYANNLTGAIPAQLGALNKLTLLDLSNNQLSGPIPKELGALAELMGLRLSGNRLSGPIPPELRKLEALTTLNLHGNELSGLWDMLGGEEAGAKAGTLPVALASLLDNFDRIDRCTGYLEGLNLSQNPWQHPPEAIVAGDMQAVRGYFEAIFRGGTTVVTRPLKVVIIGKETVGKTSLRRSIKAQKPCMTRGSGVDSTVHVDVEDHNLDGHPIRMFDCAGQVVYYGLLQLFLTPRAVYLLVWDAAEASKMDDLDLEDLAIAPWLRYLTFRVPDAKVVLVGNKWDRVVKAKQAVAVDVEVQSRQWLSCWVEKAHGHQSQRLSLEGGVSRVSCAASARRVSAPPFGMKTAWPCDKSTPGLFDRVIYDADGDKRAVTMWLPPSYRHALKMLEDLASSSRCGVGKRTPVMTRAMLDEKWKARVGGLGIADTPVEALEGAMSGAILIRRWEGGLVEYGSYIFLDVQWFAEVLDPLFSHKRDAHGNIYLGDVEVKNETSLDRLANEHVLEPQLAEELWGADLAPHLLLALKSAGLTFPLPRDPKGGLVILLRMDTDPPPEHSLKLKQAQQDRQHDLRLAVECSFSLGLPPGFVERLLARCCHLGYPYPFWRYGALIVGKGTEGGFFSLSLEYSEKNKILAVEVFGGCKEVHAWGALSKVLSVTIKMLSEFPGLPCKTTFYCPVHKTKGMAIKTTDTRPGSCLMEESYVCPLCQNRDAGKDVLAVALQVVEFSDEEFLDARLREQFAENADQVALWPGSNFEAADPAPSLISPSSPAPLQPNPVTCGCVHKAFVRWQPNACRTAAGLWGLAVTIFVGAVVPGVVEDVGALWKSSLAVVCLLVFFAAVASIFACGFGTRVEQSGGQQEPPADVAAFA